MAKFCPISNCQTNCTDNCKECLAEEKRYVVKAYLCTNFSGLMDSIETDEFDEVQDFIFSNCQKGFNCELIDRKTGETNMAYADDFNDDVEMKVRNTPFYADLLLEQQEQM